MIVTSICKYEKEAYPFMIRDLFLKRISDTIKVFTPWSSTAEEETDPHRTLTKSNSRRALHWLVQGCETGHDSLVFYFLGHGSQQRNYNGDEVNGYDESICPLDFETLGMIADDEINTTIVRPIPHGVKLHAIVDASHSSTMLDLPFHCNMNRFVIIY